MSDDPSDDPKNRVRNTARDIAEPGGAKAFILDAITRRHPSESIYAMEARGQRELEQSEVLPVEGTEDPTLWEAMGIKLGEQVPGDRLFRYVTLPAGWRKQADEAHSMGLSLLDERGRQRARIFYKAAFYDRKAFIRPTPRFQATWVPLDDELHGPVAGIVKDGGVEVFRTEAVLRTEEYEYRPSPDFAMTRTRRHYEVAQLRAIEWLISQGYPDYENPLAYW